MYFSLRSVRDGRANEENVYSTSFSACKRSCGVVKLLSIKLINALIRSSISRKVLRKLLGDGKQQRNGREVIFEQLAEYSRFEPGPGR